ncbi:LytR family transcriptional regulator [Cohnella endophytica]|uniref:LytR family transcriptional regulator n=1 Tax=Cohnella endophytica TaxID=2419778 RepID=A0A494XGD6_9BACL|nr:LCP family protein [Cohnella endophytica]RKP48771.1 LytR family transcriptional regulator [Cohnella endophytica]
MRKRWKYTLFSLLGLLLIAFCFIGWKAYGTYREMDQIHKPKEQSRFGQFEAKPEYKPPEWEGSERVNVLLMGGDERGLRKGEVARSDSMLVVSFDPTSKKIHLFSVLRDTYVDIPGYKPNRINAAITLGGPELAMKTIGNLTGLDIQYYVYVDFQGFIKLVDSVGGVDFYVEKDMKYSDAADGHVYDINLKKGQQHLDGDHALQYVRFRHDKLSDFTRTERQRAFLKAIANKLESGWNLIKLPDILGEVTPYMESNMSAKDMLKLASLGYKSHQAGSAQLPPMELVEDKVVGGSSVLGVKNEDALKGYVQEVLAKDDTTVPSASPSASPSGSSK